MKTICVLLGSNFGKNEAYKAATIQLGKSIAKNNLRLIYGGGKLGLMGFLADSVIAEGGKVTGVITSKLAKLELHDGIEDMKVVESMHERKKLMMELSDSFIALPGGLGTLEELFEIWNASKLKLHGKPLGLLDTESYYSKIVEFMHHSVSEGFVSQNNFELISINSDPTILINKLMRKIA